MAASARGPKTMRQARRPVSVSTPLLKAAGSCSSRSPMAPPRPLGSGQPPVGGRALMKAAPQAVPAIQASRRPRATWGMRPIISCQPQMATGARNSAALRPISCMIRSEMMAPGVPRTLRTLPSLMWLQLGSSTDQVASAAARVATAAISSRPEAPAMLRSRA